MQGVLDFLVSDTPEARRLRSLFVFKVFSPFTSFAPPRLAFMYPVGPSNGCVTQVVPMLNIDGVVEGNKRCNIRGKSHALKYTRCASEVTVGVEIVLAHWIM